MEFSLIYLANLQKYNNLNCLITAFFLFFLFSNTSYALGSCSQYIGQATLNEFFKDQANQSNDVDDFVEVKILNGSIPISEYGTWKIEVCEKSIAANNNDEDGCSGGIPLSSFTDTAVPWLVLKGINIGKHINLKTGFDATLVDANGDLIDYISVDGYSDAISGFSCNLSSLVFDYTASSPGTSDKTIFRSPDGTGDWDSATSATAPPTEDTTNDDLPPPPTGETYPFVTINNINADIGGTAIFTASLVDNNGDPTTFSQAVTISYYTQDGTATVADTDYTEVPLTATPATVTISAGQSSTSISISSPFSNYADIGQKFYAVLNVVEDSAENGGNPNASIFGNFGEATLDASSCSFSTTGIIGGTEIDIENNVSFNNGASTNTLAPGTTTTDNSILLDGSITNQTLTLPALPAITFVTAADTSLSNGDTLAPGNYDVVSVANNSTITLTTGTYNIDQFDIGNNVTIIISGAVVINTNEFKADGDANINTGGDPANLTVNIYNGQNAEFDLGDDSNFSGIIFSSFSNTKIEIDDGNTFVGGIFTTGEVQLKDNSTITYNAAARAAAFSVIGCLPIRIPPTVNTLITPNPTPSISGTYDSSDAAGGFTVTVAGTTYTLGASPQLTAIGDSWTLSITAAITTGIYNVIASSTNGFGNIISDATTDELTIGTGSCFSDSYPIFAGQQLDVKDNNISFTYSGTTTTLTEAATPSSAISTSGVTSNQTPTLPALPAITFVTTPDAALSNGNTLTAGDYAVVTISNNASVTLSAGTYNIDQFLIGKGATISVDGPVIINTNEFLYTAGGSGNINVNTGGNPANFIINLYDGQSGDFDLGNDSNFTGIVYSSFSNTKVEVDDNNTFIGAIITNGDVDLKDGSSINFTSAAKIAAASVLGCSVNNIDHFSINYANGAAGTGINCNTEAITIAAHDASHNVVTTHMGSISLSTTTTNGDWAETGTAMDANGAFVAGASDSGSASYTFVTADNGSIILNFRDINSEVVNLNVSGSSVLETSNAAIPADDYTIDFKPSGFIYTIPTQTSCATSTDITIQAVRTDDITQKCVSAFLNKDRSLKVWASYSDPAAASITGTPSVTLVNGNGSFTLPSAEPVSTNVDMSFEAASDETFTVAYPDAGQLILNIKYEGSASNSDAGLTMQGDTTFVVKPAKFYIYSDDTNAACASNDASCSAFKPAGNAADSQFNLKIRAACADDTVTPNFALNNIAITHTNTAPAGIAGNRAASNFDITAADIGEHIISNQALSEVGVFTFTAIAPSYLGVTGPIGTSAFIGRFYPHHFDTTVAQSCGAFTYSGQNFLVTTTAQNNWLPTPTATQNYTSTFAFPSTLSNVGDTSNFNGTNTIPALSFINGTANKADVAYTFPTKETVPETITLRANDADTSAASAVGVTEGTTEIRSGRTRLENSFGSELIDMAVPATLEYYTTNGFVVNAADTCSTVTAVLTDLDLTAGTVSLGDGSATGHTCIWDDDAESGTNNCTALAGPVASQFEEQPPINGNFNLNLKAPGATFVGDIGISLTSPTWLQYDWDGDGSHDNDPTSVASFGLYRGDDRIIYWREVF